MASTQNWTADFPVSNNRMNIFILYALSRLFPRTFFIRTIAFTPPKKASALCKFKMALKQPISVSFHFEKKKSSIDQETSGENTDVCSPLIPDVGGPQIHCNVAY